MSNSSTGIGNVDIGLPPKVDPRLDVSGLAGIPGIAGVAGQAAITSFAPDANKNTDAQSDATKQLSRAFNEQMTADAQARGQQQVQQQQADAQAKVQADVQNQMSSRNAEMLIASMGVQAADSKLPLPGQTIDATPGGNRNAADAAFTNLSPGMSGLTGNLNISAIPTDLGQISSRGNMDPSLNGGLNTAAFQQQIVSNTGDPNSSAVFSRNSSVDPLTGAPLNGSLNSGTINPDLNQAYSSGYLGVQNTQNYPMQSVDPNTVASALPQGQYAAPNIVDLPGTTSKITVDVPGVSTADGGSTISRANADDNSGGYYYSAASSYTTSDQSINYGTASSAASIERSAVEAGAAAAASELPIIANSQGYVQPPANAHNEQAQTVYRQQQDTVIEERRPSAKPETQDQARRAMNQNQKYFDQQRLNQTRSAQPPASSSQPGQNGTQSQQRQGAQYQRPSAPAKESHEPLNETQRRADAPLADQVRYGSILRRSRDSNEISEEEIELMKKLANTEDEEQSSQ